VNYELRTDPMIKLFNQSIGRLRLTNPKARSSLPCSSGRWSRCFRPMCRPLGLHRKIEAGELATLSASDCGANINQWCMAPTLD
jgi:hypothetical protein